jgi:hypothetical protein
MNTLAAASRQEPTQCQGHSMTNYRIHSSTLAFRKLVRRRSILFSDVLAIDRRIIGVHLLSVAQNASNSPSLLAYHP